MEIITRVDIDKAFSTKVNEMINKGYYIHTNTMGGSQGEIASVDFTDGTDVYRVIVEGENGREFDYFVEVIVIRVIKYENCGRCKHTLWNGKGETIYKKYYYEIESHSDKYTDDINIIRDIININKDRIWRYEERRDMTSHRDITITPAMLTKLYHMIRATKGYSGIRKCDIEGIRRCGVEYTVFMNDNAPRTRWTKRITLAK